MGELRTSIEVVRFLEVGAPVTVQTKIGQKDVRARAFLRGWSTSKFVYLESASDSKDGLAALEKGTECIVRSVHGARAYAYESRVLASEPGLNGHEVQFSWPRKVSYSAFRDSERIILDTPCRFELDEKDKRAGRVRDLSVTGLALDVRDEVPVGTKLRVGFDLPDSTEIEGLAVEVVNCIANEREFVLGCKYGDSQPHAMADIAFFVFTTQARERAAAVEGTIREAPVVVIGPADGGMDLLKYHLKKAGREILIAHNAIDGLARLRLSGARAAIVAEDLPDMAGPLLCQAVQANEKLSDVKLFRYGKAEADDPAEIFDSAATDFAEKITAAVVAALKK